MVEIIWINISNQSHKDKQPQKILIGYIYRHPTESKDYWNQIETTLEGAEAEELVLLGDLNVNFLQPYSALYRSLNHTLILPLGLRNIIPETTRYAKNVKSSLWQKVPSSPVTRNRLTRRFVRYASDFISCKREHRRHETQL